MNRFAFHKMEVIKGLIPFYKLEMDGMIPIEQFENELESIYKSQYNSVHGWMERYSNRFTIPKTKFRPLDKKKENTGTFEFKTNDLRIYGMTLPGGIVIIFGGYKGKGQDKDITQVKKIAKEIIKQNLNPNG